jgi:hypothetical protein
VHKINTNAQHKWFMGNFSIWREWKFCNIVALWVMTSCNPVGGCQRFQWTPAACIFRVAYFTSKGKWTTRNNAISKIWSPTSFLIHQWQSSYNWMLHTWCNLKALWNNQSINHLHRFVLWHLVHHNSGINTIYSEGNCTLIQLIPSLWVWIW